MGEVKNLYDTDAIKKIQEVTSDGSTCFFCSNITNGRFNAVPMSTQKVDDDGNIWFLSGKNSDKNNDVQKDGNVQLLYNIPGHMAFMIVRGKASISFDKQKIEELWEPIAKVWFPTGKDDQDISVIKVETNEGYYWDTEHGKIVSFVKMLSSLSTGKAMNDDGIKGALKIHES